MKYWKNATICMVALLCLVLLCAPATEAAYDALDYTVSDGKVTITDCATSVSGKLTVPSTLAGYPVTAIGNNAFEGCTGLTEIVIPGSVTSMGDGIFAGCEGLQSITVPFLKNEMHRLFGTTSEEGLYAADYSGTNYYIPEGLKTVTITGGDKLAFAYITG